MGLESIASALSSGAVSQSLNVSLLSAINNLDQNVAARLAASIGLGSRFDAYA